MRIEQLEYVTAVTRLGSFRAAAEELHISQPALSVTIRNLERELGVDILERRRSGTTISEAGRELLPDILRVIESADRLRRAADDQHRSSRVVRLGTVNAATVALVPPAIRAFREAHPRTQVEVINAQSDAIHQSLLDGSFDLGLVNLLDGDDPSPDLESTEVLRAAPVVCMRADNPLAAQTSVSTADLLSQPLIAMRPGYVMHRYVHRLLAGQPPVVSYATDGAEMGKLLVAEGLGVTVLPTFSVVGDPLERSGVVVHRPLADDDTEVLLMLVRRRSTESSGATRDLHRLLVLHAGTYAGTVV
jgi:DNA-binding transcriptional LysR family regulator